MKELALELNSWVIFWSVYWNSLDRSLPHRSSASQNGEAAIKMIAIGASILLTIQQMRLRVGRLVAFNRQRSRAWSSGLFQCRHVQQAIEKGLFLFPRMIARWPRFYRVLTNCYVFDSFVMRKKFRWMSFYSIRVCSKMEFKFGQQIY